MRRFLRWSFNGAAAVSAALFFHGERDGGAELLACQQSRCSFRVDSEWRQEWIDRTEQTFRSGRIYEADSRRGVLRLLFLDNDSSYARAAYPAFTSYPLAAEADDDREVPPWQGRRPFGFAIESTPIAEIIYNGPPPTAGFPSPPPAAYTIHALYTPRWIWAAAAAILPVAWRARRRRQSARLRLGLCLRCGYDLRGNTSGVCSECGEAVKAVAAEKEGATT